MITTFSQFEVPKILKIQQIFYEHDEDFNYWLWKHLREDEHYIFSGQQYFMMGWRQEPCDAYPMLPDSTWIVFFAYTLEGYNLGDLFKMMPYELPYIGFIRGLREKKDLKYYPWEHLSKLCNISVRSSGG